MLLNAMIPERRKIVEIALDKIVPNPSQPRRVFPQAELDSLSESIRTNGLLQPILVRRKGFGYELIAGERRLRACRIAGLKTVSCIVNDCDERQSAIYAMLENLQRQDLQIFEEAEGIQKLIAEWGVTQEEAAARLGKSQSTLANKIRLLRLTPSQRRKITDAHLTERHARALLRIPEDEKRDLVLNEIIHKNLNVHQTDQLIESLLTPAEPTEEPKSRVNRTFIVKDVRIFMNTIHHAIDIMKKSGIQAVSQQNETEEYIECVVRIPKVRRT